MGGRSKPGAAPVIADAPTNKESKTPPSVGDSLRESPPPLAERAAYIPVARESTPGLSGANTGRVPLPHTPALLHRGWNAPRREKNTTFVRQSPRRQAPARLGM